MVALVLDGTKAEEFALNVVEYLERQAVLKEAEAKANETKEAIKAYMESEGLTEAEVGQHIVKLLEMTRETVNTKIAKVVIPQKYLTKDGVLTTTTYKQLKVVSAKQPQFLVYALRCPALMLGIFFTIPKS